MKFVLISLFMVFNVYGKDIKIKVNPERPIYNEPFTIEFTIKAQTNDEPVISFKPFGLDVISRSETGTSTRLTYINGKSTLEKTHSISYEVTAPRPGGVFLQNIVVELGGKVLKHPTFKLNILKEALKSRDIFVRAEVVKDEVYVGEQVLIRYYLYSLDSIPIQNYEIRRFPKLDKFLKRFYQEPASVSRVRMDGRIYKKKIIYTAQVYADKPGDYKIDAISLKVYYANRNNPFRNYGINFGFSSRSRTKILSSKIVRIEAKTLPAVGMEKYFTGLVGKHSFSIKQNKNRFIANEPVEISLTVMGGGALELFESPSIIIDPSFEEFEKSEDFKIQKNFTAIKIINYTYLGRENVSLPARKIPLSYFDPVTEKYVTVELELGSIIVAGASAKSPMTTQKPKAEDKKDSISTPIAPVVKYEFKPLLKVLNTFIYGIEHVFWGLLIFSVSIFGFLIFKTVKNKDSKKLSLFESIYKNGLTYQSLHRVLKLDDDHKNMTSSIHELKLSSDAEKYFVNLVEDFNKEYTSSDAITDIKINKKYFKELEKVTQKNAI